MYKSGIVCCEVNTQPHGDFRMWNLIVYGHEKVLHICDQQTWCYEHGLSAANSVLNHGPTRTHRSHGRMWSNPDQEDVPRPGVMAHCKMASLLPFLHRSAVCFPSFSDRIIEKASTRPCKESPGIPPCFYQGITRDDPPAWWFLKIWWPWCCAPKVLANGH